MPSFRTQLVAEWSCERGVLTAGAMKAISPGRARNLGNIELTFLGHPFESFRRALDPILTVVAIGRQQPDHLIGAAGGRTGDVAGSKIDGLSNVVFVLQRTLHPRKECRPSPRSRLLRPTENPAFL